MVMTIRVMSSGKGYEYLLKSVVADPQLHTHVVVSSKAQGVDGRWHTLDSRRLHKAAVALSESYNAFFADHTARLLGVTWVPVDRDKDRNTGWEIKVAACDIDDVHSVPSMAKSPARG